jgi:predicted MFS family arabinose efflux permease
VVWATTLGAVVGPNLTGLSTAVAEALGIPVLSGPFAVGSVGMVLAALVIGLRMRPDPLVLSRQLAGAPPVADVATTSWGRVRTALRERPVLLAAVVGLSAAHAAMVAVMVMTPLHMQHGGAELRVIGFVISVHVLGMFAFSPLVGWLADRIGRPPVLGCGGGILLAALVMCRLSPEGSSWQIFAGLFLLGLGWSFATVAASTLIADHAPLDARTDVQGAADLCMGLTAASAGALAGLIVGAFGYPTLALVAVALAVVVVLAAVAAGQRVEATTPAP